MDPGHEGMDIKFGNFEGSDSRFKLVFEVGFYCGVVQRGGGILGW